MTGVRARVGVGVLVWRDGAVLLGRRRGAHGAGDWAPPGGWVDAGETVEQAAARELHEETGLVATRFRRGPWVETHFVEGVQSISLFVVAHDTVGPPALREPEQCDGWHWMPWTALPAPLFAPLGQIVAAGYHPAAG